MKKRLHILAAIAFLSTGVQNTFCQSSPGFYIVMKNKANCDKLVKALSGPTTYCLPKDPVIPETEFEHVGDIAYDKARQTKYIDLRLTAEGLRILKTLAVRLPDTHLVLVIESKVVGIFEVPRQVNEIIPINGVSPEIDVIHDKLKKTRP